VLGSPKGKWQRVWARTNASDLMQRDSYRLSRWVNASCKRLFATKFDRRSWVPSFETSLFDPRIAL
jgi:hypothetical protein